ncbi:hypothetical protein FN846DRAFT_906835 [Sphaerosporella brunnea]|uniref:Uncharacterized protein n=1 Tax=Sphaerosporella brunnea TaxID=1250544 RepID=A0A5J5EXE2_9PEZI|nr:hypothetical protein FN846DRAFT_906835 [Sphaerosporella brunnea]
MVAGIAITVDLTSYIWLDLLDVRPLTCWECVSVDVSVAIPSFVPAYIPGPNDKAISASDFPKSLQEGILALPAFIALNLGDKAQPDADAIATGIAAKVQAAGLKITVELVAEIQVLLTKILVAGVSLDVDATIQFVLVQLGVVVGAGKDNALSALPSSPTGSSSLIKAGNRKGDDSDDEDSDAEDSDDEDDSKGLDVEVDFSAKLSAVSLDAHVFVDLFGSKSSEVVHTLSSTIAATLSLKGLLSSTDPSALAAAINANIDVDLSHGHGSRVAEIVAAVKAAGLSIGIQADVAALLSADIEVALHGLGLDVDVSADVTLFKHDLVSALVGFRGMTQLFAGLDVDVNVALGAVVDELAAWLQANVNVHAELHLDAELSAKLAVLVKNAIRKGRFSRNRPSRIELSVVISEIVVDAVVALGLNVQVDGLRVDVKAALEAVIAA